MPYAIPNRRSARRMFLRKRETLTLNNAQGSIIAMDSGCLWITLERDLRDIILVPGMRFEIDRPGRTIVTAEEPSRFRVFVRDTAMHRLALLHPFWLGTATFIAAGMFVAIVAVFIAFGSWHYFWDSGIVIGPKGNAA